MRVRVRTQETKSKDGSGVAAITSWHLPGGVPQVQHTLVLPSSRVAVYVPATHTPGCTVVATEKYQALVAWIYMEANTEDAVLACILLMHQP